MTPPKLNNLAVDNNSIVSGFGSNRQIWEERGKQNTPTGLNPETFSPKKTPPRRKNSQHTSKRSPRLISPRSDIIAKKSFVGNEKLLRSAQKGRVGGNGNGNGGGGGSGGDQFLEHWKDFPSAVSDSIVVKILEKVKEMRKGVEEEKEGVIPKCITFTLWGTDNVNVYAKTMGQIFLLIGAKLVEGSVDDIELVPLDILGRPRIDVIASCSGSFRDLHMNQMILIDKAIKMAAQADEPEDMNYIRKHALEQASQMDLTLKEAATRVFSNSAGAYSSNVAKLIKNNDWKKEDQLQNEFLTQKGHAFDWDRPGLMEYQGDLFKAVLKNCDVTVQNVDLSEIISVTDVPHYYDSDPTKVIQNLREDKKKPLSLWANALKNNDREVLTLAETLRLDALKKILSPEYYERVLATPEGVRDISNCLRNVFGWAVTAGEVDTFVFEISFNVFIEDKTMLDRLRKNDKESYQTLVTTFLKANEHGYWVTNSQNPTNLRRLLVEEWRSSGALSTSRHGSGLSSSRNGLSGSRHGGLSSSSHGRSNKISPASPPVPTRKSNFMQRSSPGMLSGWRRRRKASTGRDLSSSSHGELSSIPTWRRGFSTNNGVLSRSGHG